MKYLLGLIAIIITIIIATSFYGGGVQGELPDCSLGVNEIHCLTNEHRRSIGLNELYVNPDAVEAAKKRATHLCDTGTFSHDSWTKSIEVKYRKSGENLAHYFNDNQSAFNALLDSPTHRKNIEDDFTSLGVYTEPCNGRNVIVQIFMRV